MNACVIGAGAWGTALAAQLARAQSRVSLFGRDTGTLREIAERRSNSRYLPDHLLPSGIRVCADLGSALVEAEAIFVAVPSKQARAVYRQIAALRQDTLLVSATKGLDIETLQRMSEVAAAEVPGGRVAVISGPSFAAEVVAGLPTAVVVAAASGEDARLLQRALSTPSFRCYTSDDVVGVELAGALKNVIAIAAGIIDGLGLGHNTTAALVTRGLAEMSRLALACGGRQETLAGLAGLGDLVLTCTGDLSRNRRLGRLLGRGLSVAAALDETGALAEGVGTTRAALKLSRGAEIEMPIVEQMYAVLYEGRSPREALEELMLRSLKRE